MAQAQIDQRAAALDGSSDGAPDIDPAAPCRPHPPPQAHAEAAPERLQGFERLLIIKIGVSTEGPELSVTIARGGRGGAIFVALALARPGFLLRVTLLIADVI